MNSNGRPTIVDVARRAGVSKSLVSLVLRGQPGASDANRAAVMRAVDELGYRTNAAARSLAAQRTHAVGAVVSDIRNPWFIDLLAAVRAELAANGLSLFLAEDFGLTTGASVLDAFVEARVDGLLCLGTLPPTAALIDVARSLPTVVAAGREPDLPNVDVVTGDDRLGAARAVEHLLALGHRRIAHLAGTGRAADLRTAGYEEEMRRHGLDDNIQVVVSDRSEAGDEHAAATLLASDPRPTAILANNDYAAVLTMSLAQSLGLAIPDDVSIVGYDNSYLARIGYIGLTTLDNNYTDLGKLAVQRLVSRIDAPDSARTVTLLDPTLVRRRTTAAPQ
ncbi:LacI family DNA-binding transcriptional regulator [Gordonia polyisoprenivorans]|uniref:LacI family DNA-binding transcriptional regulator n=1 Tax=Gordonia polyisoprenivorans TaxID=84595 RepID=UPI00036C3533|nr:LacI family DNA-binding transcriptional regulator [Gordonia polyisoprenivorans]